MNAPEYFNEDHRATYTPEDNKLRLYVGRVPRDQYDALRAEGWTATPKQSCDFAAVWTVDRKQTAISFAGIIEDEDQGPEDRAADRAERFAGYRDKRLDEATGHADRYDAGPQVHGYQSAARGERAAARHDRQAGRAVDAWSKAEYWTTRTAGVISHALHLSSPSVRMGRIKTLEAELRKAEADWTAWHARRAQIAEIAADPAGAVASLAARLYGGDEDKAARSLMEHIAGHGEHRNPAPSAPAEAPKAYLFAHLKSEHPPTVKDYADRYLARHPEPEGDSEFVQHLKLRLAYEWQMLEAQGGRESMTEMERGGTLGGRVIAKVNKSPKTGRVVSVAVIGPSTGERWTYGATNEPGTPFALYSIDTERLAPGAYSAPTDESRAKLAEFDQARKAAAAKTPKAPSLINPTLEDAERLQALINAGYLESWTRQHGTASQYYKPKDPGTVCQVTQAVYSANSGGSYGTTETKQLCALGKFDTGHRSSAASRARAARIGPVLCKVRTTGYEPVRVIHITDKPAKPLPAAVWEAYAPPVTPETLKPRAAELVAIMAKASGNPDKLDPPEKALLAEAELAGLVNLDCWHPQWRDEGHTWARAAGAFGPAAAAKA